MGNLDDLLSSLLSSVVGTLGRFRRGLWDALDKDTGGECELVPYSPPLTWY